MESKKKNSKQFILISLFIMIIMSFTVTATTGLNVVLANQNPDPVTPGSFVYLNVKISNTGADMIKDTIITMNENANFQLANPEDKVQSIGILAPYSASENSESYTIVKYKVYVNSSTPMGLNNVDFDIQTSGQSYTYKFDVLVQNLNPLILVKDISAQETSPGASTNLKLTIDNINTIQLKDVKIALDLSSIDNKIITINNGSNEKIIDLMNADSQKEVQFNIDISPEAESKPYLVPVKIDYKDVLGNPFSTIVYGSVKVYSPPQLSLQLYSQDIYTKGKGQFTLAIANPGTSKIKGIEVKILDSKDYEIIDGANQYIGDLNPDDFQTFRSGIYISNPEKADLKVQVTYLDSYDKKTEKTIEIPLTIYNEEQLSTLGFAKSQDSFVSLSSILFLLVGLVIGWVLLRWKTQRHAKKQK